MAALQKERVASSHFLASDLPPAIAIAKAPRAGSPHQNRRIAQRADVEKLRRKLTEPCDLEDRDLLTLLSYAVGGDGDPILGLLDDARATIAVLSEVPAGSEPNLLVSLERRLAVAMELYARATAKE